MKTKKKENLTYSDEYNTLYVEFSTLRRINRELPKRIRQITQEDREKLLREITGLDEETSSRFEKILLLISNGMDKGLKFTSAISKAIPHIDHKSANLLLKALESMLFLKTSYSFIRDMSLVYLVALYENFLQKVLTISFQKKPEILMTCQKSISYEELMKFDDIEDARQQIMEKEACVINDDVEEVKEYIEKKFNVDISMFTDWKKFKERFYRRNIVIHNSSMPNRFYRLKTGYEGKTKLMTVSKNYLDDSIDLFTEMALKVSERFTQKFT